MVFNKVSINLTDKKTFSGSGGKDKHLTTTYQRVNLRQVPTALFVQDERLWAICRGSIYVSRLDSRPHFLFYAKVKLQVSTFSLKLTLIRTVSFHPPRRRSMPRLQMPGVGYF